MKIYIVIGSETPCVEGFCKVFKDGAEAEKYALHKKVHEISDLCSSGRVALMIEKIVEQCPEYDFIECINNVYERVVGTYINIYEREVE